MKLSAIAILSCLMFSCSWEVTNDIHVENLQCEYMREAVVTKASPRFSWELTSELPDQNQSAWQILVSDDRGMLKVDEGNIWNSSKKKGNETFGIKWNSVKLSSFTKYFWKVRVWDEEGKVSNWSKVSSFITGAFDADDLVASWIGDKPEPPLDYPLLYKHMGYLSAYAESDNEEKWVQIDLGSTHAFDQIKLYPTHQNKREIIDYYFPKAYRMEASQNGDDWEIIVEKKMLADPGGKPIEHVLKKTQARYIRFTATKMRQYDHINHNPNDPHNRSRQYAFSLAELEVINDNAIISTGAKVSYKDALVKIDRENGYDPDMICDGIRNTPPHPKRRAIPPSPMLRKTFSLNEKPLKAIACVSALGLYEITLNAQSPDHRVLAPEWTDYNKRVQYQVFDVSDLLQAGTNVIGAQLADGWYAGMLGPVRWSPYFPKRGAYGLDRRLFFQMKVVYPDGEEETIVSDDSWKIFKDGPLRLADHFLGETYNANKEIPEWQNADFDDSKWDRVEVDHQAEKNLVPQINQPIRVVETLAAKAVLKIREDNYIFDIGENIAGWCRIDLKGKPGDLIILQHGEMLDEEGDLYTDNLGMAVQIDSVILGSSGQLTYEPRFTYHGFRFVKVKGLRFPPDKNMLSAKVVASDQPRTGYFSCSNPMLNQLYKNINRSHVSNMHSVPTDCPQRDERCGWMGDAYIFAQASIFNRDMAAFYNKWIVDIVDAQSERGTFPDIAPHPFAYKKHFTGVPGWADAGIQVPYILFQNYGDTEIIENHFEAYEKYIQNIHQNNPDHTWSNGLGNNYGDWLNGNTLRAEGFPRSGAQIPSDVFATIMYYNSTLNLSEMARVIEKSEEAKYYAELAANIKKAFARDFVDTHGVIEGDAQSCYALALHYGIYPDELEAKIEKRMIDKFIPYDGRMNTGFHSTLPLMKELVKRGYSEKAFQLLETTDFPSWGYSIEQGATSIWERWDGYVKGRGMQGAGMNSFNHYAFGAVGEWMYMNILGIQPLKEFPGFTHFMLKPLPGGTLTWAEGSYHSISGNIETKWKKENKTFEYTISIPANTSATVYLPGKLIKDHFDPGEYRFEEGHSIFELSSGKYVLISEI